MRLRSCFSFAFLAFVSLAAPSTARADTLEPGSSAAGVVSRIGRGVKELGVTSMLVVGYDKIGDASAFRGVALAGGVFRYFVADDLALSLDASFLYKEAGSGASASVDLGGVAMLSAGYHASLGGGLFIVPELGIGGLYGSRRTGEDPGSVRSDLLGASGRAGLALAFYPSRRFSVRAGPDALLTFGRSTPAGSTDTSSFTSLDAGFRVGMSYVF